jgi:hypothetical protein
MQAIETVTVGSGGQASITFSAIPNTFTDLVVKLSIRTSRADVVDGLIYKFNGSSGTYTAKILMGYSGVTGSDSSWVNNRRGGNAVGANNTANTFSTNEYYIPNYTSSVAKSMSLEFATEGNAAYYEMGIGANLWDGTAAITSIEVTAFSGSNIVEHSTATLYGILAGSDGTTTVT